MEVISKRMKVAALSALVATLGACGEDAVGPEESPADLIVLEEVIGSYAAETMTTTSGGVTTDQLAQGATLELTLRADGTTAGRLFVPDGSEDGGDLDADLAGTFSFDEDAKEVSFEQSADTFVRDMVFAAVRSESAIQLEGERSFGSTTVRVVLR